MKYLYNTPFSHISFGNVTVDVFSLSLLGSLSVLTIRYLLNWSNLLFGSALVKWSAIFQIPGTCETMNCPCSTRSIIQKNLISMDLDRFAFMVPAAMPRATVLSMRNTVGGAGIPAQSGFDGDG